MLVGSLIFLGAALLWPARDSVSAGFCEQDECELGLWCEDNSPNETLCDVLPDGGCDTRGCSQE